jgi:hypothetical protein
LAGTEVVAAEAEVGVVGLFDNFWCRQENCELISEK